MSLTRTDLDRYCKRIGFDGELRCDLPTLQRLHHLHALAIPFENLDSWLSRPVSLEPAAVFAKLVTGGRGGYCFEQNLLFREVLETLGFAVRGLAARVVWQLPDGFVLPRTHMVLLVTVGARRFVADVGFGGLTLTAPLDLDSQAVQSTSHEAFRLEQDAEHYVLQAHVAGSWQALYRFGLEAQMPADYAMANWYVSTHAQSRFVQQLIAGRPAPGMRHALLDGRHTRHYLGKASEHQALSDAAGLRKVLQQDLGIDVSCLPELDAKLIALFSSQPNPGA
jgi:N-hydroxyarylamine O-acetyltransferase